MAAVTVPLLVAGGLTTYEIVEQHQSKIYAEVGQRAMDAYHAQLRAIQQIRPPVRNDLLVR